MNRQNKLKNIKNNNFTHKNKQILYERGLTEQMSNNSLTDMSNKLQLANTTTKPINMTPSDNLPINGSEPQYTPDIWNKDKTLLDTHNCYDYALNNLYPQKEKTQPSGIGAPLNGYSCNELDNWLKKDIPDLSIVGSAEKCPQGKSKIMLITTTNKNDYHFLRQDADGLFSHKAGDGKVTRYDSLGNIIVDPRAAIIKNEIGDYKNQCAMYCVPRFLVKK